MQRIRWSIRSIHCIPIYSEEWKKNTVQKIDIVVRSTFFCISLNSARNHAPILPMLGRNISKNEKRKKEFFKCIQNNIDIGIDLFSWGANQVGNAISALIWKQFHADINSEH